MPDVPVRPRNLSAATTERPAMRALLIAFALAFLALFLILPVVVVFAEALRKGVAAYFATFTDPDALAAIRLTRSMKLSVSRIRAPGV